jgi:hypothetical protein
MIHHMAAQGARQNRRKHTMENATAGNAMPTLAEALAALEHVGALLTPAACKTPPAIAALNLILRAQNSSAMRSARGLIDG